MNNNNKQQLTIKKFSASWCQPCKQLVKVFDKLIAEYPDVVFETIDIEDNMVTATSYEVTMVPTVVMELNNKIVQRLVGVHPSYIYENSLRNFL